jgi:hypothetical protein
MSGKKYKLPQKFDNYLSTLSRQYKRLNEKILLDIVVNGEVEIIEEYTSTHWDYVENTGHQISLTIRESLYLEIKNKKNDYEKRIRNDLEVIHNIPYEYICDVLIKMEPEKDDDWRHNSGIYRPPMPSMVIPEEAEKRIWGEGQLRIFLSHKSSIKVKTALLKQSLNRCGFAAFVSHEDIEPTEEWQKEIRRALFTMDAMVALLSEDFHHSDWTDQEVGVAIGRGVPLIPVRLGLDPYGPMGIAQGLGGCKLENPDAMAAKIFEILFKKLSDRSKLFECALSAYANSSSFKDSGWKVENLISLFEDLSPEQADRVFEAYNSNHENIHSFKGKEILRPLLEKSTGNRYEVKDNRLEFVEEKTNPKDDLPF